VPLAEALRYGEQNPEIRVAWKVLETDFGGTETVLAVLTDGQRRIEIIADLHLDGRQAI
jgi:hypothetical protein